MKKSTANEIAVYLKEVARNTTNATAFKVAVYPSSINDDYYVELLPDYERRTKDNLYSFRMASFHHIKELATIESYHHVLSHITATEATYSDEKFLIFRVNIF